MKFEKPRMICLANGAFKASVVGYKEGNAYLYNGSWQNNMWRAFNSLRNSIGDPSLARLADFDHQWPIYQSGWRSGCGGA